MSKLKDIKRQTLEIIFWKVDVAIKTRLSIKGLSELCVHEEATQEGAGKPEVSRQNCLTMRAMFGWLRVEDPQNCDELYELSNHTGAK